MSDLLNPELQTLFTERENQILAKINCIQIGKIDSYDMATQSASVQIQVKRRVGKDAIVEYPLLVECPVIVSQGGGAFLEMPIEPGDFCLLLFNDRDIDNWYLGPGYTEPGTKRKHSLSDAFVLVGINPSTQALDLSGDAVGLIGGDKKIRVKNNSEDLLTLLSDLIDAINAIVTTGSPTTHTVNAASQAALDAIKTRISNLLVV